MFLVRFLLAAALLLPAAAVAQSSTGFSDGAPICANTPNPNCPGQTLGLNGAFAAKQNFPITSGAVPGVGGITFSGTPSVGQVPTATGSAAATWQTPITYWPAPPAFIVSNWYIPNGMVPGSLTTPTSGQIRLIPAMMTQRATIGALGSFITTLQAAQNFQLAIYAANPTTFRPTGTALASTASMSTGAGGFASAVLSANIQVQPGQVVWLAYNGNSTTAIFTGGSSTAGSLAQLLGSSTGAFILNNQVVLNGLQVTGQAFGSWPDLTSATFTETVGNQLVGTAMQIASVP